MIYKGCSTSGLIRLVQQKHKAVFDSQAPKKDEEEEPKEKFSKQSSIATFLEKGSLGEILSKLAACDGFSIRAICKSDFIRKSLTARQFQQPKSETAIMKLIHQECEVIKAELKSNLNKKEATMSDSHSSKKN